MKEFYNCFIGFPLSSEFKHELQIIQKKLHAYMPNAAILDPLEAHITLYYLGKQSEKDLEEISDILYEEQDIIKGEEFKISDLGIFYRQLNSENIPYVLYLKVAHTDRLITLREHLASHLDSYNKDDDRGFVPHLTLGRLKTTEAEIQFKEHSKMVENLLSTVDWQFKLKEVYIYGKENLESSKFQETLYKIPLI
jgi:2'-5' RNA ligase